MKSDKKIIICSDIKDRRTPYILSSQDSTLWDRVIDQNACLMAKVNCSSRSILNASIMERQLVSLNQYIEDMCVLNEIKSDVDWKMSFGEYLLDAMMNLSIYPRHIAEETGLTREYIDQILEDEILPWQLSVNLIFYFNEKLNLEYNLTKCIIDEHVISPDLLEKLYYSANEYQAVDLMDQESRKKKFMDFTIQEENRRREFLRLF